MLPVRPSVLPVRLNPPLAMLPVRPIPPPTLPLLVPVRPNPPLLVPVRPSVLPPPVLAAAIFENWKLVEEVACI